MIYESVEQSAPIRQSDIFVGLPSIELPKDELPILDGEEFRAMSWQDIAQEQKTIHALLYIRPAIGIVGTQNCDASRARDITLFEIRPFGDVAGLNPEPKKSKKWVEVITKHARLNQKWLYLPPDDMIGFTKKMGVDFMAAFRMPRVALERLRFLRKGRLNNVAKEHFRERIADFFRRYPYDEWYPLNQEEFEEYSKKYPGTEPFSWQTSYEERGETES